MVRISEPMESFLHTNAPLGSALDFYPEASQSKGCGFESHVGCLRDFLPFHLFDSDLLSMRLFCDKGARKVEEIWSQQMSILLLS